MAARMGKDGMVKVGANDVAYIDNWSLDIGIDGIEVSAYGDSDRKFEYGLRNVTGQISGTFDSTDAAQTAVMANVESTNAPAKSTVVLIYNNTTGSIAGYTGSALLTSISLGSQVADKVSFSASLQYDGGVSAYSS